MAIKDILVHMDLTPHCEKRFNLGLKLASRHNAQLFALFSQSSSNVLGLSSSIEKCRKVHNKAGESARKSYKKLAEKAGVQMEWQTATFPNSDEVVTDQLVQSTQHMDLTLVGQFDRQTVGSGIPPDLAERLVLETGRPILVVPYAGKFKDVGKRVLIAWNTGRESVRAVNDAIPLIKDAKRVNVIAINPYKGKKRHGENPAADITRHLIRHGIKAAAEHLSTQEVDPGNMLLSCAADESADLLVMGAYGHHRFRELVLGGVTQEILKHMTLPVLMSH